MLIKVDSKFIVGHNAQKNTLLIGSKEQARNFYTGKGKRVLKLAKKAFPDATIDTIDHPHAPRGRAVAGKRGRPPKAKSKRGPGRPPKAKRGRPPKAAASANGVKRGPGRPKGSKNKPKVETPTAAVESNATATAPTTPSTQA